jgi:hypothetical protein
MGGLKATPDWLAQLAPDRAPPMPGWWPLAPGWWLLALLIVSVVVGLLVWWLRPHRRLRRMALGELKRIAAEGADLMTTASAIENLMRRFALARFGRARVARLSGEEWLAFVVAEGGTALAGATGKSLLAAAYGSPAQADAGLWLSGARAFFRTAGARKRSVA